MKIRQNVLLTLGAGMLLAFSVAPAFPQDTEVTADQASQKRSDVEIMRNIRQSIVADDMLSMTGKNVKVIAIDGEVTLRGQVNSEEERANIIAKAAATVGEDNVIDKLTLKGANPTIKPSGKAGNANQ